MRRVGSFGTGGLGGLLFDFGSYLYDLDLVLE
jgi:hypothetical protein